MDATVTGHEPPLPPGERLELPGRGTTFVRAVAGPPGAPTVLLLHGWLASGGLNWFNAFEPLSQRFSVVAPDLRGHGRGIRGRRRFRLADCADDAAALLEQLSTGPVIAVGYSMGGPVAQLLWRRHPEQVAGLVFCATSDRFVAGGRERMIFGTMMASAAGTTRTGRWLGSSPLPRVHLPAGSGARPTSLREWAAGEMRRHDLVKLMEAGQAIGNYSARRWIGEIDVPTTVMVTRRDRAVRPEAQMRLANAISGAEVVEIDDGHIVCGKREFGPALVRCVDSVAARVHTPIRAAR
ncbi:MAG: alpha/beta hydrolase [Acidimicrobiales bacterium]